MKLKKLALTILCLLGLITVSFAQVKQTLTNPFPINPKTYTALIAMGGSYSDSFKEKAPSSKLNAKQMWLTEWNTTDQEISWVITTPLKGDYNVVLMIRSNKGERIEISSDNSKTIYTTEDSGWQRSTIKSCINLNKGVNTIKIKLMQKPKKDLCIKSIELYATKYEQAIEKRIAEFKGDLSWMKTCGYGIMTQVGGWSYPKTGDKKPWPGFVEDFDVKAFVEKIDKMGAKFLVWSGTWSSYHFPAPIKSIEKLLPGRTSERDLIAELIAECKKRDIRFMLYYHSGHGELEVIKALGMKEDWITSGGRDKSEWFDNQTKILSEIGQRYGKGLDGVFVDGACAWYPVDYEVLGNALKAGNPDRVVCHNPWYLARFTPFQDFYCGEGYNGVKTNGTIENGIYTRGPQKGLQAWGCFVFDGPGWGARNPGVKVTDPKPLWTPDYIVEYTKSLEERKFSIAINVVVYEDGSIADKSYEILEEAAKKLKRGAWAEK